MNLAGSVVKQPVTAITKEKKLSVLQNASSGIRAGTTITTVHVLTAENTEAGAPSPQEEINYEAAMAVETIREACRRHRLSFMSLGTMRFRVWFDKARPVHILVIPGRGYVYGSHGGHPFPHPIMGHDVPMVRVADQEWGVECTDLEEAVTAALPVTVAPEHSTHGTLWRRLYLGQLHRMQSGMCHYCQKPTKRKDATIDHLTPLSRGGKDQPFNMAMACRGCNEAKDDQTVEEFMNARV